MKNENEVVFRQIEKEDIPSMTALFNSQFLVQKPNSYFNWQVFDYFSPVSVMGTFQGSELVGTFGIQRVPQENGLVCGRAHWPVVSPEWHGKDVFTRLKDIVLKGQQDMALLFNFFPEKSQIPISRSLDMKMYLIPSMKIAPAGRFSDPGVKVERVTGNADFRHLSPVTAATFRFNNTRQYQRWRYAENPFYSYDLVSLDSGEYAITKNFKDPVTGATCGDIVEVECSPDEPVKMEDIVKGAAWHLQNQGMENITTWALPGTALRRVTEAAGFIQDDSVPCYFGLKILDSRYDYLYDLSRWNLQQGDHLKY